MRRPLFFQQTTLLVGLVVFINVVVVALAFVSYESGYASLSAWVVAYTLGLRHGFDADHIAVIDNSVRRLCSLKKEPTFTGFFFALGHSSVVFVGTIIIVLLSRTIGEGSSHYAEIGATIATIVSVIFLLFLGLMNVGSVLLRKKSGVPVHSVIQSSFFCHVANRATSKIQSSWFLLPIGMLFGLGFETATEVALLANAARDSSNGLEVSTVLLYPCLFMAGMLAIDSIDGLLMVKAFTWSEKDSRRRYTYNVVISLMTGTVALVIATIQLLSLLNAHVILDSVSLSVISRFSSNTELIGMSTAGILLAFWLGWAFISRLKTKSFLS